MKKTVIILLSLFVVVSSSCVSKGTYNELENQYNRLEREKRDVEDEYSNLVSKYNELVEKYNGLLDDYNETVSDNEWNRYASEDKDRRLDALLNHVNKQSNRISELTTYLERIKYICTIWNNETSRAIKSTLEDYSPEYY